MLRKFKLYTFNSKNFSNNVQLFSSYPGFLLSSDDYYQLYPSNLLVWETTNSIFNRTLYGFVQPTTVLTWMRTIIANRMGTNGEAWCDVFSKYNSGTYNNQWGVVNYALYSKGLQQLQPGTLWILEQIPGLIISQDMTPTLQSTGYWASYNIPYFEQIYNTSEYPKMVAKYGSQYSYTNCARGEIFKRDVPLKANDMEILRMLLPHVLICYLGLTDLLLMVL